MIRINLLETEGKSIGYLRRGKARYPGTLLDILRTKI
jgi:hypothetical protein